MTTRSEILQFVMHDINAHLASNNVLTTFDCIDGDERKNDHIWKIEHHGDGHYWEQHRTLVDRWFFTTALETVRQRGDCDTTKFTAISIYQSTPELVGDTLTYELRISYQRIPIVRPELPIVDGASDIVIGRYERTKKTLFSSMFEYCVTKKLYDGECCCAGCDSDRQRGDPPNSYISIGSLGLGVLSTCSVVCSSVLFISLCVFRYDTIIAGFIYRKTVVVNVIVQVIIDKLLSSLLLVIMSIRYSKIFVVVSKPTNSLLLLF